jgi:hypothetical protein
LGGATAFFFWRQEKPVAPKKKGKQKEEGHALQGNPHIWRAF